MTYTPLFEAASHESPGCIKCMEILLAELGESEDKSEFLGLTQEKAAELLCWAAFNDDIHFLDRLEKCGIDLEAVVDYDGRSCLDVARDMGRLSTVRFLERKVKMQKGEEKAEALVWM